MRREEARSDTGNIKSKEIVSLKNLPHLVIKSQQAKVDTR